MHTCGKIAVSSATATRILSAQGTYTKFDSVGRTEDQSSCIRLVTCVVLRMTSSERGITPCRKEKNTIIFY